MYTLRLKPVSRGAFSNMPARTVDFEDHDIMTNDVVFDITGEFNPNKVRLWVIGNEFGALVALWAPEHEVLDAAVDLNRMDSFLATEEHEQVCNAKHTPECEQDCPHTCEHALLGNASEPFDLTYCWMQEVDLDAVKDLKLLLAFAEARGNGSSTVAGYIA